MNAADSITTLNTRSTPRSMGDILVASGRLRPADLQRILDSQAKNNTPFGETAISLQLLTKEDIDQVLSQQFNYAYLNPSDTRLSPELVAAYQPFSVASENLRAVRSQLVLRWFNGDPARKVLAVVSAGVGEGRSFVSANLAIVFAQQGQRTLLIDADLRAKPERGQHSLFKLERGHGLSAVLAGRASLGEAAHTVPGLDSLMVLPAGAVPPNPQELLGQASFGQLLNSAAQQFDVILIDTPAGASFADAELVAARAGAALIVARKNATLLPATTQLAKRLQDGGVALVGSVLNDA
ncbi:chain length determinant protein tyrosine kinase EpsG [Rhodoferax sp. U11-2br]|uniref:chain length determinant protein tyrosine kinase EpsG n=1 Tax=Rhodoferax sp. U11-2br TaxID=2838878 RepID=UPI001BE78582|nr:chain length determinant protein tyrosine kinase EpsG [Rhodoferax sp. U11-2br]MBT3068277.1 chain length determinant protein tyrosine kinase EpsG [Rhodoferax sp. U11-2br]